MLTTRISLLLRIRDPKDSGSWLEFHQLYSPLIFQYARSRGLSHADADEIRSSCYETIVKRIKDFDYVEDKGGFKAWLRRMVLNRVIDLKRKRGHQQFTDGAMEKIADDQKTPEEEFNEQWKLSHLRFCLERIKLSVSQVTFRAFEMLAEDATVPAVCSALDLNENQVYKAKSKVLRLVREQMRSVFGEEMA